MIRFKCRRSLRERVGIWLQKEREYPHYILENIADLVKEALKVDDSFTPENVPDQAYFNRAKAYLLERGEECATVHLLRSPVDNRIVRGGTRIPLKVETKKGAYIIKTYDDTDSELEREVLQTVSGKIGPQVLHFGQQFYSEELIDSSQYTNLLDRAWATGAFCPEKRKELWEYCYGGKSDDQEQRKKLMCTMVEAVKPLLLEGARMHAELAKLKVNYNHNHWLDEFHVANDGKPMITDFGTSYLFLDPAQVEQELPRLVKEYDELHKEFFKYPAVISAREFSKKLGSVGTRKKIIDGHRQTYNFVQNQGRSILSELTQQRLGNRAKEVLAALKENQALVVNLLHAEESAHQGIKGFFEDAAVGSGYDYASLVSLDFQAEFFNHYFS